MVAEADEETLKEFFSEIEKGPPLAEVTDIRYQFEDKDGGFTDFEILY
ncbi:MAG: acylphosphatase [Persephonella sp.]|nr:acylphosphatase [Persephonella sp.]